MPIISVEGFIRKHCLKGAGGLTVQSIDLANNQIATVCRDLQRLSKNLDDDRAATAEKLAFRLHDVLLALTVHHADILDLLVNEDAEEK